MLGTTVQPGGSLRSPLDFFTVRKSCTETLYVHLLQITLCILCGGVYKVQCGGRYNYCTFSLIILFKDMYLLDRLNTTLLRNKDKKRDVRCYEVGTCLI